MDKTGRNGIRIGDLQLAGFKEKYNTLKEKHLGLIKLHPEIEFDLEGEETKWFAALEELRSLSFVDGEYFVNEAIQDGKNILAEGAQGSMLDIDFGTYPYVTSSNTVTSGVCNGLGIAPSKIDKVYGIAKAYCTRVGSGPFPTELHDDVGEKLRRIGKEFGATTGRPRRCGWIDLPQLSYTVMVNGVTDIIITKLDVLDDFEKIMYCDQYNVEGELTKKMPYDLCHTDIDPMYKEAIGWNQSLDAITEYTDLPLEAKSYLDTLQELLKTKISMVSTGPERRKILEV
jgi:adenylosuccinate synthase